MGRKAFCLKLAKVTQRLPQKSQLLFDRSAKSCRGVGSLSPALGALTEQPCARAEADTGGDDRRVGTPRLLRSLPRYYISVVGGSCPEISFSEAKRKGDNGMSDSESHKQRALGRARQLPRAGSRTRSGSSAAEAALPLTPLGSDVPLGKAHAQRWVSGGVEEPVCLLKVGRSVSSDALKSSVRAGN